MAKRRIVAGLEIAGGANEDVDAICADYGMNKNVVVARIIAWFTKSPESLQRLVLVPPRGDELKSHYAAELRAAAARLEDASTADRTTEGKPQRHENTHSLPRARKGSIVRESGVTIEEAG